MNCPQCQTIMVVARATSFGEPYHYCRNCKRELVEIQAAMTPTEATLKTDSRYFVNPVQPLIPIRSGYSQVTPSLYASYPNPNTIRKVKIGDKVQIRCVGGQYTVVAIDYALQELTLILLPGLPTFIEHAYDCTVVSNVVP